MKINVTIIFLCIAIFCLKTYMIHIDRYTYTSFIFESWKKKDFEEKRLLKKRFLGFKNITADLYWIYFLQCDHLGIQLSPDFIFNCADLITYLDPHFNIVYRFAALGLSIKYKRYDLANILLKKAIAHSSFNKDDWRIYFYIGYNYYFFLHDTKGATYYIKQASKQPTHFNACLKKHRTLPPNFIAKWSDRLTKALLTFQV